MKKLERYGAAYIFDKAKIRNSLVRATSSYMQGCHECKVPAAQTEGELALTLKDEATKLFAEESKTTGPILNLITSGDNYPIVDYIQIALDLEIT